ncbi:hypothetical protein [Archangium sp.]|jgi:hypothetical protein|uniref:hypothetical protein n=1 Tax=Archangium sp. TaxID=1872627 RepID=UPI002ED81ED3
MELELRNRRALVTGSTLGIGFAIRSCAASPPPRRWPTWPSTCAARALCSPRASATTGSSLRVDGGTANYIL